MIWLRAERFTTFEFHFWNFTFMEVTEFQQFWSCLHARVYISACVCVLVLEGEKRQRVIITPWEHRDWKAMTRVTGSLWPHFGTGVACALTSKLLHIFPPPKQPESPHTYISCFPGGDLFSSINHLIKLGFIFILVLYVMLLLVHEHFQQLFMTFHHCTSHFLGAFSHLVTEASCLPMQSECS